MKSVQENEDVFTEANFRNRDFKRLQREKGKPLKAATVICLDKAYQKGQAFKVLVDHVKQKYEAGDISIFFVITAGSLKKLYIKHDPTFPRHLEEIETNELPIKPISLEKAKNLARELEKEWKEEHEPYLKESRIPYEIISWESLSTGSYFNQASSYPHYLGFIKRFFLNIVEWILPNFVREFLLRLKNLFISTADDPSQNFQRYLKIVNNYYQESEDQETGYQNAVKNLTKTYIESFVERCKAKGLQVSLEECIKSGIEYGLEEAAMTLLILEELADFITYPGTSKEVLKKSIEQYFSQVVERYWIVCEMHKRKLDDVENSSKNTDPSSLAKQSTNNIALLKHYNEQLNSYAESIKSLDLDQIKTFIEKIMGAFNEYINSLKLSTAQIDNCLTLPSNSTASQKFFKDPDANLKLILGAYKKILRANNSSIAELTEEQVNMLQIRIQQELGQISNITQAQTTLSVSPRIQG